jgi:predicted regulator of Ras-like GTPase activity (Roadblock/LC7/MglB family)
MDLTLPLKTLVAQVPGAVGAVLIDTEGEAITYFSPADETERVRLIGAYHRIWLSDCLALAEQMRLGQLAQMIHRYETGIVLVQALKDNHALVLIGEPEMFVGQGLMFMAQAGEAINEDL